MLAGLLELISDLLRPFIKPVDGQKSYLMALFSTAAGLWFVYVGKVDIGLALLALGGSTAAVRHTLQKILERLPKE